MCYSTYVAIQTGDVAWIAGFAALCDALTRVGSECRQQQGNAGQAAEQGRLLMPAEEVVSRSGLGAQVITSFLFEHYVHMIAPEAIEDAAAAAEKFSDAICMLGRASDDTGTFGTPTFC